MYLHKFNQVPFVITFIPWACESEVHRAPPSIPTIQALSTWFVPLESRLCATRLSRYWSQDIIPSRRRFRQLRNQRVPFRIRCNHAHFISARVSSFRSNRPTIRRALQFHEQVLLVLQVVHLSNMKSVSKTVLHTSKMISWKSLTPKVIPVYYNTDYYMPIDSKYSAITPTPLLTFPCWQPSFVCAITMAVFDDCKVIEPCSFFFPMTTFLSSSLRNWYLTPAAQIPLVIKAVKSPFLKQVAILEASCPWSYRANRQTHTRASERRGGDCNG